MSKSKVTLAKKLKAGGRVQKLRAELEVGVAQTGVADIEDTVAAVPPIIKSQFFSPVQTRRQRVSNFNPPQNLVLKERKPRRMFLDDVDAVSSSSAGNSSEQWQPKHWQQHLSNIRKMRSSGVAPVDTMGCHKCSDEDADEKTQRFHKLVALMLSSQTKDETTYEAMRKLKENTLTPQTIVAMEASKLQDLLRPVSFYKNKTKHLQQVSQLLIEKYDSDIPQSVKELEALPGVGPKMAHICMATAWNEVTGIGVDVHVHRITNRLHWMPDATKKPEQTRVALESWLPRHMWLEVNHLLVGFGQTVCTPLRPHCGDCLNRDICPGAEIKGNKKKTSVGATVEAEHEIPIPIKKSKVQRKNIILL